MSCRRRVGFQGQGVARVLAVALLGIAPGWPATRAFAQAEIRNLTQPIPVVNSGGHSAPVRALVFAPPDGTRLLSAGFDKVVQVWNLGDDPPGLSRTIRPRIWRGYAGAIYSMALAPQPGADGHRLLAVAGFGLQNTRGEIPLFRYPGSANAPNGDVAGELPAGAPLGHTDTVMSLAFDPRGRYLASASMDRTLRLWDLNTRTSTVLAGHTQAVNAVVYSPDGRRLVSGGADGLVILWDSDRRVILAVARPDPRDAAAGNAINALAVSGDGRWVVIGRENGNLVRFEAANLGNPALLPRGSATQGAIEALAISHDGRSLVTSTVSYRITTPAQRPRVECDIELRNLPDGAVRIRLAQTSNLVYACAFSPDDRRVAYAGGDAQTIAIHTMADPARPVLELAGQGSSLWDIGFSNDSRAIGFARRRPDLPDPPVLYEDFDLQRIRVTPFAPAELSRAVLAWNGWTVRPVDPYTLDLVDPANRVRRLSLHPQLDRRWWSYSFVPPGPEHARAVLAVGCEAGVALFRLDDGLRTRLLAGHSGPVYAVAPSPDGRWLATGSSDQTARLWRLAGCDTPSPLGARFGPPGAGQTRPLVASVDRFSFAEAMGMKVGDEIEALFIAGTRQTQLAALDTVLPNTAVEFLVRRQGQTLSLGTTKRHPPALTLFPALDREWILWTPEGYYETSVLGDRRYLGWHRNRTAAGQPTDYFSFDHFEKELRRGDALLGYLRTADRAGLAAAVAANLAPNPAPVVPAPAPAPAAAPPLAPDDLLRQDVLPVVQIIAPVRPVDGPLVIPAGMLALRVRCASEDPGGAGGRIGAIRVLVDGRRADDLAVAPPLAETARELAIPLPPGRHRLSVTAVNERQRDRTESFEVIAQEPPAPAPVEPPGAPEPRLVVLSIGAGTFPAAPDCVPAIAFAGEDARDLSHFLSSSNGAPRYPRTETQTLIGPEATVHAIAAALERLEERRGQGELVPGDAVFVMIESHFVRFNPSGVLLGTDSDGQPQGPGVSADTIADCLGRLADYGCKVVLLVDSFHERRPEPRQSDRLFTDWARSLYRKNVITFVASIHGPSQRLTARAHGAFAQGILDSQNVRSQSRLSAAPARGMTLHEFQDVVARNVQALTNRQQFARCYVPETISSRIPLFEPPARSTRPVEVRQEASGSD